MSDYQRHGTKTDTTLYTAFASSESGQFVQGMYVDMLGQKTSVGDIDYNVGGRFNRCSHRKSWNQDWPNSGQACFAQMSFKGTGGQPATSDQPARKPVVKLDDSVIMGCRPRGEAFVAPSNGEIAQARYDAYQRLIHLVPNLHMNHARAAVELKDTKQTVSQLVSFTKWAKGHLGKTLKFVKRNGRIVTRKIQILDSLASLASAYLWYSFGVEPTVSDVKTFINQVSKGSLKVLGSKKRVIPKGTVMVQRFSAKPKASAIGEAMFTPGFTERVSTTGEYRHEENVTIRLVNGTTWYDARSYGLSGLTGKRVMVSQQRGCYFAEVVNDITIDQYDDLNTRMQWNCPFGRSLWDLTPFSFLLDWFVDVGQVIENLDHWNVGSRYTSQMGPVWLNTTTSSQIYEPALERFGFQGIGTPEPPVNWSYGGTVEATLLYNAKPELVGAESLFTRDEADRPGLPPLEIQSEVKAYQISSGMALLMQFANGLRH